MTRLIVAATTIFFLCVGCVTDKSAEGDADQSVSEDARILEDVGPAEDAKIED